MKRAGFSRPFLFGMMCSDQTRPDGDPVLESFGLSLEAGLGVSRVAERLVLG